MPEPVDLQPQAPDNMFIDFCVGNLRRYINTVADNVSSRMVGAEDRIEAIEARVELAEANIEHMQKFEYERRQNNMQKCEYEHKEQKASRMVARAGRSKLSDYKRAGWLQQISDAKQESNRRYREKVKKAATKKVVHKKPAACRSGNPSASSHMALSYPAAPRHEEEEEARRQATLLHVRGGNPSKSSHMALSNAEASRHEEVRRQATLLDDRNNLEFLRIHALHDMSPRSSKRQSKKVWKRYGDSNGRRSSA